MSPAPVIDGRDRDDFRRLALARAPYYVPEWDTSAGDFGAALLELHAELAGDVAERADRLPEKHRAAFVDTLGFERAPPSPSRLAVSVAVTPAATENVPIPAGTRVVATGVDGGERTFEVSDDDAFEATPARLRRVVSVVPRLDTVYDHTPAFVASNDAVAPRTATPFRGQNRQEHALYLGDDDLLTLSPGSSVDVIFDTEATERTFARCLQWEYYGVETAPDGTDREGWHRLVPEDEAGTECPYVVGRTARRYAARVAERLSAYTLGDPSDVEGRDGLAVVGTALREWFVSGSQRAERAVLDALLPADASDGERAVAREVLRRLEDPASTPAVGDAVESITLEFTVSGVPTPTTVAGVESRWLRGRLPPGEPLHDLFAVTIRDPAFRVLTRGTPFTGGVRPDRLLSGVAPVSVEEGTSFYPLGPTPRPQDAFYVASSEAFTKRGEQVTLGFTYADGDDTADRGVRDGSPALSWEYWDGVGWTGIAGVRDGTEALTTEGMVSFTVPADLAPSTVVGRAGHWIRARLVEGEYVRTTYTQSDGTIESETTGTPPRYGDVRISYNTRAVVSHLFTHNGFEYSADLGGSEGPVHPFVGLPDGSQTLYFGFDGPLVDGPLSVLFDVDVREYPVGFRSRLRWERCVDPVRDEWVAVDATDRTAGLTERGTVTLTVDGSTVRGERFGSELHWLRARLTGDEFAVADDPLLVRRPPDGSDGASASADGVVVPEQTGERLVAGDRTAGRTTAPPTLGGIYPNTGWARDLRTIERELLGSSDGSTNQSHAAGAPPVLEETVWVDESTALSAGGQADLAAERPADVESVTGPDGRVREFWVRWTRVPSLLGSGADDRHYTLDATAGRIRFGDGVSGRIPPRGRDNVRVTYRTGGGAAGNVPVGAVTGLTSAIPLIESVTNPVSADGGADEESTAEVLGRAPGAIRDRGRAVAAADLERITKATTPRVARAKCLPGLDPAGESTPGWVTLIVVPDTPDRKPVPSLELRGQVLDALREHAPAALVAPGRERLVVRGPNFVTVSVEATVVGVGVASVSTLERLVQERVSAFLNPLTGGPGSAGWWFGELPSLSEVYAMLERTAGIDHVERLSVTYRGSERDVTVTEGEALPTVAADVLVYGGPHDITVSGGR